MTAKRKTTKRAVGYVRVSRVGGREGESFLSPDVQRERIEAWAAYRDYRIVDWYVDLDQSGRTMSRPEFERMMVDARADRFDAVVVYRLTRFARSVRGASNALDELLEHGVGLVSVSEDIDTTTAGGKLTRSIFLALAEFESDRIGEEWRNVHANRRGRGIAHVARGAYGYRVEHAAVVGVDDEQAEAVRLMFDMRERGVGLGTIRNVLFERGFRPPSGGTHFGVSSIKFILDNPLYAGMMRDADELVAACHEAIVSLDQWRAVQTLRQRGARAPSERRSLLAGVVVCSGCGRPMKHELRGGRRVYRCVTRWTTSETCPRGTSITADALEEYVVRALLLSRAKFKRRQREAVARGKDARQRHASRLNEIARALDRLTALLAGADDLVVVEYERQVRQLVVERATITDLLAEMDAEARATPEIPSEDSWDGMSHDRRRETIRGLVRRIVIAPATRSGGRRNRGVDLEGRVRFELTQDDNAAHRAVGQVIWDAIDWDATAEVDGPDVVMRGDVAGELMASPLGNDQLCVAETELERERSREHLRQLLQDLESGVVRGDPA